jgi:hypothetical protein
MDKDKIEPNTNSFTAHKFTSGNIVAKASNLAFFFLYCSKK